MQRPDPTDDVGRSEPQGSLHWGAPLGFLSLVLVAGASGAILVEPEWPLRSASGAVDIAVAATSSDTNDEAPILAQHQGSGDRFIVRFRNRPDLQAALAAYTSEPVACEKAFETFAVDHAPLDQFRLIGVSASGEAILEHMGPPGRPRDLAEVLSALEDVAYADPDFQATIGRDE